MKTNILKGGLGVLKVNATLTTKNSGTTMFAKFPVDTVFDWYPLNAQYTYKYSEKHDLYYLTVDTDNLILPRYGVVDNKGGVNKKRSHITQGLLSGAPEWVNPHVKEDNAKVFEFAKGLGIVTPETEYELKDVLAGLKTFQKSLDALYDMALGRCVQYPTPTEKSIDKDSKIEYTGEVFYEYRPQHVNTMNGLDEESRAQHVLKELNDEELELYIKLGEVYTMLSMMQKIVIARG